MKEGTLVCGVWECDGAAVERLVFCNPRSGGTGVLDVCLVCLVDFKREHLL